VTEKPRRLGRGLEALLGSAASAPTTASVDRGATLVDAPIGAATIPITRIRPNPFQPRREFRDEELAELAASLQASGLLQPIMVRPAGGGIYELVAGERRLRAAAKLGWTDIQANVREFDDRQMLTVALVENLQRADLDPIEEAEGYQRLVQEFGATQQQVAEAVGKDRSTVANALRLLGLPTSVRRLLQDRQLTVGHARALLGLDGERQMLEVARTVVAKGLNVRDVERIARLAPSSRQRKKGSPRTAQLAPDPQIRRVTDALRRRLQTDVHVSIGADKRGEIRIAFYSADDLERVLEVVLDHPLEDL
jgi:ParB family chromosome partitioning protein